VSKRRNRDVDINQSLTFRVYIANRARDSFDATARADDQDKAVGEGRMAYSVTNLPGWIRSLLFPAMWAVTSGCNRVIHVESDAFLRSGRTRRYGYEVNDGQIAPWCPRYQWPASAFQTAAGGASRIIRCRKTRPPNNRSQPGSRPCCFQNSPFTPVSPDRGRSSTWGRTSARFRAPFEPGCSTGSSHLSRPFRFSKN